MSEETIKLTIEGDGWRMMWRAPREPDEPREKVAEEMTGLMLEWLRNEPRI